MRPILYSFRRCPYAMRARVALDAASIEVEHREVLLREKPAEMLAASPKGTVPVLIAAEEQVLDESLDIMLWALGQNDPEDWLHDSEADRRDVETFLDGFKTALDRYKYASRYDPEARRGSVDHDYRTIAMTSLIEFTASLGTHKNLRADQSRLIDIALFPFIRQFAAVEPDWWAAVASEPLQTWLSHHTSSERFQRIMRKRPVWSSKIAK